MKKIIKVLSIIFILVVIFTGCGGNKTNKEPTKSNEVVTMMGFYDESIMKPVIDAVNKELNGAYQLEYSFVTLQQYNNVLSTQLASGEGPDIIADGASYPARIKAENLVNLSNQEFINNFNESGMTLTTNREEEIYGIPTYGWFSGIWYNKDIFKENNVDVPETFDELINISNKLKENKIQPIGFGLSDGDTAQHSLIGYLENSFYNKKENKMFDEQFAYGEKKMNGTLNNSVEQWSVIIKDGIIDNNMLGISNDQALNAFINNEVAMIYGGPWNYESIKESGMNFGMFSHVGDVKSDKYLIGGPAASIGVNKNSKNMDGAMKALEAFASDSVQKSWLEANPGGFSYKKGVAAEIPSEYELIKNQLDNGFVACAWDRWGVNMPAETILTEIKKQIQNLISEQVSVDEFLENIDKKADEIRYK